MFAPSNLPSYNPRAPRRDGMSRVPTSLSTVRLPRKAKAVPGPASRQVVQTKIQSFICLAVEPEDAKITGATRSLSRRLLALNMRHDS